jgi:hypothetical protein
LKYDKDSLLKQCDPTVTYVYIVEKYAPERYFTSKTEEHAVACEKA